MSNATRLMSPFKVKTFIRPAQIKQENKADTMQSFRAKKKKKIIMSKLFLTKKSTSPMVAGNCTNKKRDFQAKNIHLLTFNDRFLLFPSFMPIEIKFK